MILITTAGHAQKRLDWKGRIDFLVEQIDSLSMKSQRTFYLTKYLKNLDPYKETWYYTLRDDKVVYFEIHYVIATHEYTEIYYVDRNHPICMEHYEYPYLGYYVDELLDGKMYFIDNDAVKLYVALGQKQTTKSLPFAESNCIDQFDKRFTELKKTLPVVGQ